jgi:hypothetical protein
MSSAVIYTFPLTSFVCETVGALVVAYLSFLGQALDNRVNGHVMGHFYRSLQKHWWEEEV